MKPKSAEKKHKLKLIGEGSYGCVFKPTMTCKKTAKRKKQNYTNKIAKFMYKEDALKELAEYTIVKKIDPASEYFLGKPNMCSPDIKENDPALEKCRLYQESKTSKTIADYSILILQDGGEDLVSFSKYISELSINSNTTHVIRVFWTESVRLMKGLLLFEKNGISHHDLKPQNIVYNKNKRRAKFIDFGLTRRIDYVLQLCRNDKNRMSDYAFWTYPFEFAFLNRNAFMRISSMSFQEKIAYFEDIVQDLKRKDDEPQTNLETMKFSISLKLYFDYITRNYTDEKTNEIIYKYMEDFKNMILYEIVEENYIDFLKKSVRTIDSFGFALSMQYVLCYCRPYIPDYLFDDLEECYYNMMTPSVLNRYTISDGFLKIQEILKENEWLKHKHSNDASIPQSVKAKTTVKHMDVSINRNTHDKLLNMQHHLGHLLMKNPSEKNTLKNRIISQK